MRRRERSICADAVAGLAFLTLFQGGASVYAAWLEASARGVDRHAAAQYSSLVDADR